MATSAGSVRRIARPVRRALKGDFVRHGALVFGATMAVNVLNYAFNFVLSRRLGVEGFATLSSLISFIMIFSIPASILTLIIVKYTATFHAAGDAQRVRRLSVVLLKWTAIGAVAASLAGVLLQSQVAAFLRISDAFAVPLCVGILALSFITPSVRGILQGEQDFRRYSVSTVLEVFLKVLIAIALVYAGFGVAGAMLGWLVGILCALSYTIWAVLNKHGAAAGASVRLALDMRRLALTTLGVGFSSAFMILLSFMDVLLVKHYFDPRHAGLYAAVNMTGKVVLFGVAFVPNVLVPKAVAKTESGESARALLLQAIIVTVIMCGGVLLVFGTFPEQIMRIFAGADFVAAAPYVLEYDSAMCLLAIVTVLVNYRIGVHRFEFLYPLAAILACEVAAIMLAHGTLWDVITILLVCNALAVAICSVFWRRAPQRALGAVS